MGVMQIVGALGLVCVSLAILLRKRKKQDELNLVGGILLFAYSISIRSAVFVVLQGVFVLTVLYDLWRARFRKG